nr:reverse transcriptase domain-containing protein [Tanacetum cinerariifolium]
MADQRTMAELLQAPTEGYGDAIVIPAIFAENFELKHSLLNLVTSKQFCGFERKILMLTFLELVESKLGKSNFLSCNYFPSFDCFELVKNRVVGLDELHWKDGVHYFPDYSLLRLQRHMLEYYLDILGKRCHRWQDTSSKDVVHHK